MSKIEAFHSPWFGAVIIFGGAVLLFMLLRYDFRRIGRSIVLAEGTVCSSERLPTGLSLNASAQYADIIAFSHAGQTYRVRDQMARRLPRAIGTVLPISFAADDPGRARVHQPVQRALYYALGCLLIAGGLFQIAWAGGLR